VIDANTDGTAGAHPQAIAASFRTENGQQHRWLIQEISAGIAIALGDGYPTLRDAGAARAEEINPR
jgi:hypothetical protein